MIQPYRSYSYLEAGRDYRDFQLAPELHRVPSLSVPLDPGQQARAGEIKRKGTLVSIHDHPTVRPLHQSDFRNYRIEGREVTGYEGLSASSVDVVVDGMMAGAAFMTSRSGWKFADIVFDLGMRQCDVAHQGELQVVRHHSDFGLIKQSGNTGIIFAIESAAPIENELDRLDILFGLGVRVVGLTYNNANALGSGLSEANDGGLTKFGRAAIKRMNQIGMVIDLSHTGERTSLEAIEASENPVSLSHTGARALWDVPRLKSDEVLRACAERGGLIGITASPHTTVTSRSPRHCLDSVMAHFEHCANLVGIDHVGFGPDTNFGDHVAWHREFAGGAVSFPDGIEPVEYVEGVENPAEAFDNVLAWLLVHGYSDQEIERALGANALQFFAAVWPDLSRPEQTASIATDGTLC